MKIACLQIAPELGQVDGNIVRAERLLADLPPEQIDILVLPELAFSGYNFPSLEAISPFLEPTAAGVSAQWAKRTAQRLKCIVKIGYPEVADTVSDSSEADVKRYNSTVTVSPEGEVIGHYRKSFLYYTDETWASEGSGFYSGFLPASKSRQTQKGGTVIDARETSDKAPDVRIATGICMDINPYKFEAPWDAFEFANHCVDVAADVVLVSTAWLSHTLQPGDVAEVPGRQPDLSTLSYWFERFRPVIQQERKTVVVFANRAGIEGSAVYAGTSAVLRLGAGDIELLDVAGKGEERLLVVNTEEPAKFALQMRRRDQAEDARESDGSGGTSSDSIDDV